MLTPLSAVVAVELVHSFSLSHDDVMDGDRVRRERAALWRSPLMDMERRRVLLALRSPMW